MLNYAKKKVAAFTLRRISLRLECVTFKQYIEYTREQLSGDRF